ncbi:putative Thioredoxin Ubiquitin elongating factor core [Trypanosoma vivax]|nr:putative Thioredoxin Ubiquitin elongating factor core [Trypanosoma vivax]
MLEINGLQQLHSLIEREPVVVVEFYTDWCGACQIVRNQYEAMSNIYSSVMFGKCNIERSRDLAQALSIESIPTFVVWLSGEVHKTIRGADVDTLRATVEGAMRNVQGGALPESRKSRINSSGAELAQRMEALARAINSASADKAAEQVACDAICAMIEKDSKSQPFGVVLLPYFASTGFDARAIDALFTYIKSREHPQCRECEFIVNGLVTYLIECFLSVTLNDTKELDVLRRALYSMVCCSSILPILVSSHLFYSDSITDGLQLEYNTLLGALLGVSIHDRSARAVPPFLEIFQQKVLMETFPNGTDDHSIKIFELQLCMESCCAANKSIILALLHSKVSRFPTLRFLGTALRLNASYSKTMRRNLPLSSQFFMVQMNDVLVEAALPVFSCFDPQSIPAVYVLNDPSEHTVVDFGDDVERITHYSDDRPLPPFPLLEQPFRPSVHLFFLAARCLTLSTMVLIETHERLSQELTHFRLPPEERAVRLAEKCLIESLLGSKSLGGKRMQVLNGMALWLVGVMHASPDGTLAQNPPENWQYLPQQLVDVVIGGTRLAPLDSFSIENIISLMLLLMGNTAYFPKPHTHALFPDFLVRLMHNTETDRVLTGHRWFREHIVRRCILCYIAVERSTYEKVQVRYTLSHCIKSFLAFESLCQPVREEFQMDGTILERFSHMVIADVNDSVDQLTETLLKMNQLMSSGADLSENASPSRPGNGGVSVGAPLQSNGGSAVSRAYAQERGRSQSEEDEDNGEYSTDSSMTYHRMGLDLKERIHLFEASIDLFIQLAESFSKGVAQNMVAQQIGQMLARSLTCFVGTESKRLKIEHPERYNFRPREILGRLVRCLVQFRRFHNFLRCLCNCGVPLNDILKAMRTVVDRGLVSESLTWKLNEIASALEAVSAEINEDEALWDEAPEYALDALLSTPLLNPLALPADVKDLNDLVYANEETIHHLLLSECKHPFTKKYLDEKMVREFNEREDVSRARQQLQDRIAQWLNDAKKKRQPN